jgi:tetratricopeptide (TPR) repeat protein/predicted Ser/Thr protein kinase
MTPERWRQVRDVFALALQRPPGERRQYLEQACAADATLAAEVAGLLAHDALALGEEFLTAACPGSVKARLAAGAGPLVGRRLGPYEVRQHVASGGMGDVYRAVRVDDYRQTVAVKVIRPGLADDELRQRFRTERQVLAGLNHPNVVRLLDGGATEDGLLYFVMEYIDGEPLDRWCARRRPALREQLRLLLEVARAVDYAHQQGVIHRDLKPGNVLVTPAGVAKITDFGLAKRLDQEAAPPAGGATRTGVILGTPNYLAPEQAGSASGAVGPATDVYALGAILYELLTGRPPFRGATLLEALEQVRSAESVPPSRLHPQLPRDLETVCLKALAKEPGRRYATAAALAADLDNFLLGRPVAARPVGRLVQLARGCRRKPLVAGLSAALVLVLLAAFAGVTWEWRRAEAQLEETRREHRRAEENLAACRQILGQFASLDKEYAPDSKPDPEVRLATIRIESLEVAIKYYEDLRLREQVDLSLREGMAGAYRLRALLYAETRQPAGKTRAAYEKALASYQELADAHPGRADYEFGWSLTCWDLGRYLCDHGRAAEALVAHESAGQRLRPLVRQHPDRPLYRKLLGMALYHSGRDQARLGRADAARTSYREAAARFRDLAEQFPEVPAYRRDLAASYHNVGNLHADAGAFAEAVSFYRRALPLRERLSRDNPDHLPFLSDVSGEGHRLGEALQRLGRREEALAAFQRSVEQTRELVRKAPGEVAYRQLLTERCRNLARLYRELGRADRAAGLDTISVKNSGPAARP